MCVRACVYACVSVFCLLWQLHIFVSAQNKRLASRHKVDFVATKLPSVFAELCKKRVVVAKSVRLHVQTHGIAAANVPFFKFIFIYLFIVGSENNYLRPQIFDLWQRPLIRYPSSAVSHAWRKFNVVHSAETK